MKTPKGNPKRGTGIVLKGAVAALSLSAAAFSTAQSSYRIGEDTASADAGPVRMARFSLVSGQVDWRPAPTTGWSSATINMPLKQGSDIWAPNGARGEIQFDDGSDLRMTSGAVVSLSTLYSDNQGEFTEVKLTNGLVTLHLTNKQSLYQIDTPSASIKAYGPADIRVGDTSGLEVAVHSGQCMVEGKPGNMTLTANQYINLLPNTSTCQVTRCPSADNWDRFNTRRDSVVYVKNQNLPPNIGLVAGNIDSYGSWHQDTTYGQVWTPNEPANWSPYQEGNWQWEDPYGWTWVGAEPWGWAPYHYGTWLHEGWGWAWRPGPAVQCWSPAVVDFSSYNGNVAWCPLSPAEVSYPAFNVGFGFGGSNWWLGFSIGAAGCYYPAGGGYCSPYFWGNRYANGFAGYYRPGAYAAFYANDGAFGRSWGSHAFLPRNFRYGGGVYARSGVFGRTGGFGRLDPRQSAYFTRGQSFMRPGQGGRPISGPFNVHPTAASFSASRRFNAGGPSRAIANRPVYRAPLARAIAQHSAGVGRSFAPGNRMASLTRGAHPGAAGARANRFAGQANRPNGGSVGNRAATGGRTNAGSFGNRAATSANRYNRFNSVSKSQFTRPGAANTNRAAAAVRRGNRSNSALTRRTGAAHTNRNFGRSAAARPTRSSVSRTTRTTGSYARAHTNTSRRSNAGRAQSFTNHTAPRSSYSRPSTNRSFSAPRSTPRSYSAPRAYSSPRSHSTPRSYSAPRSNYSAPRSHSSPRSYSAPRSNYSAPRSFSAPRSSPAPRSFSAPRSSPGGGGSRRSSGSGGRRRGH